MKKVTLLSCALVVGASMSAQAQSPHDLAAWFGIMMTPVGALPQIELAPTGAPNASHLAFRAASWSVSGSDVRDNNLGITYFNPASATLRYSISTAWLQPDADGADGTFMVGGDVAGDLWKSAAAANNPNSFSIDWRANLGFGRFTGDGGGNSWSIVGQVPFKWTHQMASNSALSAFASAGFGFAGIGDDTDSESGTRPIFGFGGAWTSAGGLGIHLSTQKVMLDTGGTDSPPWNSALSVSIPMGGKK
jgi:hypothetical protein